MHKKLKRKKKRIAEKNTEEIFDETQFLNNYGNYFKFNISFKFPKKGL